MLRRRAGGHQNRRCQRIRHGGAPRLAETWTTDQDRQLLPGAAGSLWMMPWNAGLACWLMRRLGAVSVGELDRRFLGRGACRRPERAPADPILIGAASARAVTDDQFLPLENLSN